MLITTALLGALAFAISYITVPMTIPLCRITGATDRPDGVRKLNTVPIPRLGGLAFFIASVIILLPLVKKDRTVGAILTGGAVLAAGGVCDDIYDLPWRIKLLFQICAAAVAVAISGVPEGISLFGILNISLPLAIGLIFILFRMLFSTNAVNFSDGLDGLAAGISITALFSMALFGYKNGNIASATAAFVIACATLGFVPYNKYRARVYMGDTGAQFLGLSIALLSVGTSPDRAYTLETSLFLAIPAIDTFLSVIRRVIHLKNPFKADRGHLHHLLLTHGVSHPDASRLLTAVSALIATGTLLAIFAS